MLTRRTWTAIGTVGAVALFGALALLTSLGARPFQSADENEHVAYALNLGHGHLPTLYDRVQPEIPGMVVHPIYTANHPPLFYLVEAIPLRVGTALGHPVGGLFAARLSNVVLAALLAAATRASGLEIAGLAVLSAAGGAWLQHREATPVRPRAVPAALCGSAVAAVVGVGIGWFYLRNRHLYGDTSGARVVLGYFPAPHVPVSSTAPSPAFWSGQYQGLFGRRSELTGAVHGVIDLVGLLVLAAIALALGRVVSLARRRSLSPARLAVVGLLALHVLVTGAVLVAFVSRGGLPYSRYLLPGVPVLALAVAYGLALLPALLERVVLVFLLGVEVVVALVVTERELAFKNPLLRDRSAPSVIVDALRSNAIPTPPLLLALLLLGLVAAFVVVLVSTHKLRDRARLGGEHPPERDEPLPVQ